MRKSSLVAGLGILVLLAGLGMPATTTDTVETCYNSPTGFGQECSTTTVERPNTARGPVLGLGVVLLFGGIAGLLVSGSSGQSRGGGGTAPESQSPASGTGPTGHDAGGPRSQPGSAGVREGPATTGSGSTAGQSEERSAPAVTPHTSAGGSVTVELDADRQTAVSLVELALEHTDLISQYHETEFQIVAKTGTGFPRVLWSYGETLYINFHEGTDPETTLISVSGEKDVSVNVGANPEKVKRAFLSQLEYFRQLPEAERREYLEASTVGSASETAGQGPEGTQGPRSPGTTKQAGRQPASAPQQRSKQVAAESDLSSGSSLLLKLIVGMSLLFMFLLFVSLASV